MKEMKQSMKRINIKCPYCGSRAYLPNIRHALTGQQIRMKEMKT